MIDLYMIILGCNLKNRFTEQHDVFFDIAPSIKELKQNMYDFGPKLEKNYTLIRTELFEKLINIKFRSLIKMKPLKIMVFIFIF